MRKYDSKNKFNIGIIVGVCIVFAIIFSYFLIKEIKLSKVKYYLDANTLVFDIDKNNILLNEQGTIKKKWNKNYYLTYKDDEYQIGSHVIAFNNRETSLTLYGEFYEVNASSEVNITKEETKLNNLGISRFYKISDRKYLIIDSQIKTSDDLLKTTNYLIIELDKQGNAILYNNNVNVKTFSETKIVTTTYTFDIANELLIYENETVDLKKILGTTNEHKKPDNTPSPTTSPIPSDNTGNNGDGNNGGNGNNNTNNPNSNTNPSGVTTNEPGTNKPSDEIINETSYTSIINITPSINNISVDYVIYDKKNEYLSTYVEIRSKNSYKVVYLSKGNTNISLTDLIPGTTYDLTFKYTHLKEGLITEEVIDKHTVTTKFPNITLGVQKLTSRQIYYKIDTSSYQIDSATLRIYIDNERQNIALPINNNNLTGSINISNLTLLNNSILTLRLEDIIVSGSKMDKSISWSYKVENNTRKDEPVTSPDSPKEDNNE